jgi:hypothetical protein
MIAFWDIASGTLVEVDGRFREAYCLHHPGDTSQYATLKRRSTSRKLHCDISQKPIFILAAVRT